MKTEADTGQVFSRITMCFIIWIAQISMELCLRAKDDGRRIETNDHIGIKNKSIYPANLLKFLYNQLCILSEGHELSYIFFHILGNQIFLACLFILINHGPFLPCFIHGSFATVVAQP